MIEIAYSTNDNMDKHNLILSEWVTTNKIKELAGID